MCIVNSIRYLSLRFRWCWQTLRKASERLQQLHQSATGSLIKEPKTHCIGGCDTTIHHLWHTGSIAHLVFIPSKNTIQLLLDGGWRERLKVPSPSNSFIRGRERDRFPSKKDFNKEMIVASGYQWEGKKRIKYPCPPCAYSVHNVWNMDNVRNMDRENCPYSGYQLLMSRIWTVETVHIPNITKIFRPYSGHHCPYSGHHCPCSGHYHCPYSGHNFFLLSMLRTSKVDVRNMEKFLRFNCPCSAHQLIISTGWSAGWSAGKPFFN